MQRRLHKNKEYSTELKVQAVEEYLSGKGSQREVCRKYGILAKRTLEVWIMWYNGHKEFKERSRAKGEIHMTKGRKTTQEERAEIVAFCIEHNKDYGLTVETYNVSYQQIYAWVRKYEEGGVDKLKDNRGRPKPVEEMTEVEKLKAEMKILEAKNRQLEIENAFIKKLRELKGGGR
ncbi:MAG: transposase [Clostridia bacterium]|nr:transposase [Clostridia bacterium]